MNDYGGYPGDLTERETLARLTIEEKRRLARAAIMEFPHLDHALLDEWLCRYGVNSAAPEASLQEKTDALLDQCETLVRSGEEPEALDRFIYSQLDPAILEVLGIAYDEVARRVPLDVWNGVYDEE